MEDMMKQEEIQDYFPDFFKNEELRLHTQCLTLLNIMEL